MSRRIEKAAVIGAGTMGAGIAAQFANAGIPVHLLDIVPAGAASRSTLARAAVERQIAVGGFVHPDRAALVVPGNLEDDLPALADADWIVEAVIEQEDIKRSLYRKLDAVRRDGCVVSSNTSTIPRATLVEDLGARFASEFVITHFFNPPRRMRLLELVAGDEVDPAFVAGVRDAGERLLGKTVIDCRDTPGFVANRLGCYWMSLAAIEAFEAGLTVEQADAVVGAPFGVPPTGIFGLLDLVGLDLIPGVWGSLYATLAGDDPFQDYDLPGHPVVRRMIAEGRIGRKAGGGFYRQKDRASPKEALDLDAFAYRPATREASSADLRALVERDDAAGRYAWKVLSGFVAYAAHVAPEIADDVPTIDLGMALGYAWARGPFALADRVGVDYIAGRLRAEGRAVPPLLDAAARAGGFYPAEGAHLASDGTRRDDRPRSGVLRLQGQRVAASNGSARLLDMGEGVACLELLAPGRAIDLAVLDLVERLPGEMAKGFRALVVGHADLRPFCSGFDIALLATSLAQGTLADLLARGQRAFQALRQAPFPMVAAASGPVLGAGAEWLMHCDAAAVHVELSMGFDQARHGLMPASGGCARLLERLAARPRAGGGHAAVGAAAFDLIFRAATSRSAHDAQASGMLRAEDVIVMNADHVLAEGCRLAASLVEGYTPPPAAALRLSGASGRAALMNFVEGNRIAGRVDAFHARLADAIADVLTGGDADPMEPVPEDRILDLERHAIAALTTAPETRAAIAKLLVPAKGR